jgi:hypothetical protein
MNFSIKHPLLNKINIEQHQSIEETINILKSLDFKVKQKNNLLIVNYSKKLKKSCQYNNYINKSRSIIIDFQTKKIICNSLDGSVDLNYFLSNVEWNNIVIEDCLDGMLLNLYYHNNHWKLSTKFCINADESFFKSNKTFRQYFDELVDLKKLKLNKKYTYVFLLRHISARNITPIKKNEVIHLETINNITLEKIKEDIGLKHTNIIKYKNIINILGINSFLELKEKTGNLPWYKPGYMLYSKDRNFRYKLVNPNFEYVNDLVKDQNDKKYIVLKYLFDIKKLRDLLKFFPEYKKICNKVNLDIYDYTNDLYKFYCDVKINKIYVKLEQKFKKPIFDLHHRFKNNRIIDKKYYINYQEVCNLVRNYDTPYLYSILYKTKF